MANSEPTQDAEYVAPCNDEISSSGRDGGTPSPDQRLGSTPRPDEGQIAETVRVFPEQAGADACYCEAVVGCHVHVRRYDGGTEHADWCPDYAHAGKCLDKLLEKIEGSVSGGAGGLGSGLARSEVGSGVRFPSPADPPLPEQTAHNDGTIADD